MKREIFLVAFIVLVGVAFHAFNMFEFPYYENDEGTYMSQAWSVVSDGELAPYTYWYDHSPVGWLQIALWTVLTGGLFTFGFAINSGRVLMLLFHAASTIFVYLIMRRLKAGPLAAAIAALIFSISPLAIYYHRRVLLDNIMVFWTLLSFWFGLRYDGHLRWLVFSAGALAIAILSKETALLFLPAWIFLIIARSEPEHRRFAVALPLILLVSLLSMYPLYAALNGELMPAGPGEEHVSLVETAQYQASRGGGAPWLASSHFQRSFGQWWDMDPFLVAAGIAASVIMLVFAIFDRNARFLAIYTTLMWAYFLRGGLLLEFYVIDIVPFLAMSIGYVIHVLSRSIGVPVVRYAPHALGVLLLALMATVAATDLVDGLSLYTADQTAPQIAAVEYMLAEADPGDIYVVDGYAYLDLEERWDGPKAVWYWKVDRDPQVRSELLGNRSSSIDYIAETPQVTADLDRAGLTLTQAAFANAQPIGSFAEDEWGVTFWATKYPDRVLNDLHESYVEQFTRGGRTFVTTARDLTRSEDQALLMLRSVYADDQATFNETWTWTQRNLELDSGVFASSLGDSIDPRSNAIADIDAAYALLLAAQRWNDPSYEQDALELLDAIWAEEVVMIEGEPYLVAGNWAAPDEYVFFPGAYAPAHFTAFSEHDADWGSVSDSMLRVLAVCSTPLPKEVCTLDADLEPAASAVAPDGPFYASSATELPFRIGLAAKQGDEVARRALAAFSPIEDVLVNGTLPNALTVEGVVVEDYASSRMAGASLPYFTIESPQTAELLFNESIIGKLYENLTVSYIQDPTDGETQQWAWLGTAFLYNKTEVSDVR